MIYLIMRYYGKGAASVIAIFNDEEAAKKALESTAFLKSNEKEPYRYISKRPINTIFDIT